MSLNEDEKKVIDPCITLMKCSFALVKKISDLMPFTPSSEENLLLELDQLIMLCKRDIESVDQLGSSIYPPQTSLSAAVDDIVDCHAQLMKHIRTMLKGNAQLELVDKFLNLLEIKQSDSVKIIRSELESRK